MSQKVTLEVALTLKKGDRLYHNIIAFGGLGEEAVSATAVVTGKFRARKGVEQFELPIKRQYSGGSSGSVSRMSQDLWRTVPEKIVHIRSRRVRPAIAPDTSSDAAESTDKVTRVRRTRTIPPKHVSRVRG